MIYNSISLSTCKGFDPKYHKYFTRYIPHDAVGFSKIMASEVWSPIAWKNNTRLKDNFEHCKYMALDFDDGMWTLPMAHEWLDDNNFAGIIGTSKSHQKEKVTPAGVVSPPCDRFRVVVPFSQPIIDMELYEFNMAQIMRTIPCDPSCKDAARFFFPCKKITYARSGSSFKGIYSKEDTRFKEMLKAIESNQIHLASMAEKGLIPSYLINLMQNGVSEGGRHTTCYRLGAQLSLAGWSIDEIVAGCMAGPLSDIGYEEVRRAVKNGFNKAMIGVGSEAENC